MTEAAVARGLSALAMLRDQVPVETRLISARAVAARCRCASLAVFLAHEAPAVAVAFLDRAILDEDQWLAILPDLGPLGRSRLRGRDDMPASITRALEAFGSTDFALGAPLHVTDSQSVQQLDGHPESLEQTGPSDAAIALNPQSDIASLVRRIEAYRTSRAGNDGTAPPANDSSTPAVMADEIRLRSDAEGHIRAVAGAQRSSFVGLSLAEPARATESGFDAGVARAFSKRAPIRSGRLWLTGEGLNSGHWLIDADPSFDRASGRFQGYSGTLRRPIAEIADSVSRALIHAQDVANPGEEDAVKAPPPRRVAEGMRQMVHELRSPLNAINGFAELIEGQFFGPVAHHYRALARSIVGDAAQLAGTFDDFDVAARLDMGNVTAGEGESDIVPSVHAALSQLSSYLAARNSTVEIQGMEELTVAMPESDARRLVSRFISSLAHHLGEQAQLVGRVVQDNGQGFASVILDVPSSEELDAIARRSLVDPGTDDHQGVIGIEFTLRLIDRLATMYGGSLQRNQGQFILNLPLVKEQPDRIESAV
ncbi:HAMP domain-containing histidine kinase [Sphingomonas lacunae]|uniref:histidine kinase n=1 Tax=Sphingomonas lacunae TaxID=2698828 RepID=A0A6M4AVF6_9SPHN|nr:HAMP domain-containing histidine kinase [Sphingomonas lacunae]QJQ33117.1 HAMP domain-containing histidine kinase [Sphingomonas lacunae]